MKRLWLCVVAALALSSCIDVDDFGMYWNKDTIDPALEGTWRVIDSPGQPSDHSMCVEQWKVIRTGSAYEIYRSVKSHDPAGPQFDSPDWWASARTLRIGRRRLLMQRTQREVRGGLILGYEIHNRSLRLDMFGGDAAIDYLNAKHPDAKNIQTSHDGVQIVHIGTLDDEARRILSELDGPQYWHFWCAYQKASP